VSLGGNWNRNGSNLFVADTRKRILLKPTEMRRLYWIFVCVLLIVSAYEFGYSAGLSNDVSRKIAINTFCIGWRNGRAAMVDEAFKVDSLNMEKTLNKIRLK
jgi:hypothetical protein